MQKEFINTAQIKYFKEISHKILKMLPIIVALIKCLSLLIIVLSSNKFEYFNLFFFTYYLNIILEDFKKYFKFPKLLS
jgi:hypothetical protein